MGKANQLPIAGKNLQPQKRVINSVTKKQTNEVAAATNLYPIRRELNLVGKFLIFGVYSICIVLATATYQRNQTLDGASKELLLTLKQMKTQKSSGQMDMLTDRVIKSYRYFYQEMEKDLFTEISSLQDNQRKTIKSQQEEIAILKDKMSKLMELKSGRSISSVPTTITYSVQNGRILRYEQRLQRKRFLEKQKTEKEAFLLFTDLKNNKGQNDYNAFVDQQKLDLYKLDQDSLEKRSQFKQLGYR